VLNKFMRRGRGLRWLWSHDPINFRALNDNSFKIAKDFKFDTMCVKFDKDSPDTTPEKNV